MNKKDSKEGFNYFPLPEVGEQSIAVKWCVAFSIPLFPMGWALLEGKNSTEVDDDYYLVDKLSFLKVVRRIGLKKSFNILARGFLRNLAIYLYKIFILFILIGIKLAFDLFN